MFTVTHLSQTLTRSKKVVVVMADIFTDPCGALDFDRSKCYTFPDGSSKCNVRRVFCSE